MNMVFMYITEFYTRIANDIIFSSNTLNIPKGVKRLFLCTKKPPPKQPTICISIYAL